jgi:hypothetical protein
MPGNKKKVVAMTNGRTHVKEVVFWHRNTSLAKVLPDPVR